MQGWKQGGQAGARAPLKHFFFITQRLRWPYYSDFPFDFQFTLGILANVERKKFKKIAL
jgi:hypothetical protein